MGIQMRRKELTKTFIVPLELEGAELPLYKVAVKLLLTPRGRYDDFKMKKPFCLHGF